jgi:hypothetical protein
VGHRSRGYATFYVDRDGCGVKRVKNRSFQRAALAESAATIDGEQT